MKRSFVAGNTHFTFFRHKYSIGFRKKAQRWFDKPKTVALTMPRVAEIDRAILAQLRTNGRMSYVELAKEVGASERTVRTHVRKMEEDGTIRGYTVREGGVGLTALVRIKVSPGAEIGSFASEVTGWDGIEIIYEVSGNADLVALVHVDDTMALRTLLDKMWLTAPNEIASTTTELVLEQY